MKISVHNVLYNVFSITTTLVVLFLAIMFSFQARAFVVLSDSMAPVFYRGDVIFVRPVSFDELQEDDIITAHFPQSDDSVFTHRIIAKDSINRVVYTRGDSNMTDDPMPTAAKDIIGMYWFSIPNLGVISFEFGSVIVYVALGVAILLIISGFLVQKFRKRNS